MKKVKSAEVKNIKNEDKPLDEEKRSKRRKRKKTSENLERITALRELLNDS